MKTNLITLYFHDWLSISKKSIDIAENGYITAVCGRAPRDGTGCEKKLDSGTGQRAAGRGTGRDAGKNGIAGRDDFLAVLWSPAIGKLFSHAHAMSYLKMSPGCITFLFIDNA